MSSTTNISKDQAIKMLADGIPNVQIASALGVDESYISQLKTDPEIQERIQALAGERTAEDMSFDDAVREAEKVALDRIARNLPHANMGQALNAFKALNAAKLRRDGAAPGTSGPTVQNVTLVMPMQTVVNYVTNTRNEIVEVEGKTMISASVKSLDDILAARAGTKDAKLLPGITDLEVAAQRLDSMAPPRPVAERARPARKLPSTLSADVL